MNTNNEEKSIGDGENIEKELNKESLSRKESTSSSEYVVVSESNNPTSPVLGFVVSENELHDAISGLQPTPMMQSPTTANVIGKSIFYDCLDASPLNDNNSFHKSDTDDDAPTYDIDQNDGNFTIFSNVVYLGSANINAPRSESEIYRKIAELNCAENVGVSVKISIPNCCDGSVVLYDEETDKVFADFDIQNILRFSRGLKETSDSSCFAFSWSHGDPNETGLYQCHVFKCNIPEAIVHVSACFAKAFKRVPSTMTCSAASENLQLASITSDIGGNPISQALYEYTIALELRERDSKNIYANVNREKSCFKLRSNCDKEICITVKPTQSDKYPPLFIERCFGVLLSVGKVSKQAELTALELSAPGTYVKGTSDFQIVARWDNNDKPFEQVLQDSQKKHIITLAIDLVIKGIQEPVRFVIETNVKIENVDSNSSRFSNSFLFQSGNKRPLLKKFYIQLKDSGIENNWILSSVDPCDDVIEPWQSSVFNQKIKSFSKMVRSTSSVSFDDDVSQSDDTVSLEIDDEPLASGTGEVSRDCSDDLLLLWAPVINEWQSLEKRPKNLAHLIRNGGIPEALRCRFWQKLCFTENRPDLADKYRILITKETKCEDVILRDIGRTFPAHDFFKEGHGNGQESLYKVSKAYSVFDQEVGYCQGLSFIAASLLLHMPEEDAFSVLVSIMYDYGLRDLYKEDFEILHKCLFQLSCMMRDYMPDLHRHFLNQNLELHMFASHWFLTLFTHRFPLPFVFHCIDLFLLDGINVIFQIAYTLLYVIKEELLSRDFEGILKFIKNSLPKKFRTEAKVMKFIKLASDFKVKKLKKYEDEYNMQKKENENFERRFAQYQQKYNDDKKSLQNEIANLNEKVKKMEMEHKKYENIIHDYKQIIQRQELHLEALQNPDKMNEQDNKIIESSKVDSLGFATQRIRELETELVLAKVSQAEAECKNQTLQHQLNNMMTAAKNSQPTNTPPNNSSTLVNLKSKWDNLTTTVVNNVTQGASSTMPTFQSHISELTSQLSLDESKK